MLARAAKMPNSSTTEAVEIARLDRANIGKRGVEAALD
jgi:hypothetical protein